MARLGRKPACITVWLSRPLRGFALRALGLSLASLAACTSPHILVTARHTPCKPKEIVISEFTQSGFGEDWYASCRDKWYRCNTREQGHRLIYACRPAEPPLLADASAGLADAASVADAGPAPAPVVSSPATGSAP
jgi:hypothetical protein